MALHGPIKVNDDVIGTWSAIRRGPLHSKSHQHSYDCNVTWRPEGGDVESTGFVILHKYDDGALVLTQRVMTQAIKNFGLRVPVRV